MDRAAIDSVARLFSKSIIPIDQCQIPRAAGFASKSIADPDGVQPRSPTVPIRTPHDAENRESYDIGLIERDNATWKRFSPPDYLNGTFVVATIVALYVRIIELWWTYDDAFLLHYVIRYHPREYLFNPQVWQEIPQSLFTPVLALAYDTDVFLFGVATRWYYIHHLSELMAFGVLVYAVARLWHSKTISLTCVSLVIMGAPFCAWATQLMLRHYVEASVAALAATLLFVRAERDGKHWLFLLSAAAYFVAICAKEIAVPLPAVLLLLPHGSLKMRVRPLAVHAVALAVYIAWRYHMLGTLFGGYGWAVTRDDLPTLLVSLTPKIVGIWSPSGTWAGIPLLVAGSVLAALSLRTRKEAVLILVALCSAILPIAPVSKEMQLRFAMVPWVAFSFLISGGLARLRGNPAMRQAVPVVATVLVLLAGFVNRAEWHHTFGQASRMSAEARAFLDLAPGELLRNPAVPPAAMSELQWLKTAVYGRTGEAAWSFDDIYFCVKPLPKRVIEFQQDAVHEVTATLPHFVSRYCAMRTRRVMEANFSYRDGSLFWQLGPYADGEYRFVIADGVQAFDVPRRDGFQMGKIPGIAMRIRHRSPAGEITYSPTITIDFAKQRELRWSGPGEAQ